MTFVTKVHYILLFTYFYADSYQSVINETLHREKRSYFIFPRGGTFKLVVALAVPIKLGLKQNMAWGVNFQFQFAVPTNISQISEYPPIIRSRRKRQMISDRAAAYYGLELILDRYGINGHSCLLHSICQNSMNSFYNKANGLYGQLLHIFLTPDYGDSDLDTDLDSYLEAESAGKYGIHCDSLYKDCGVGENILDMISIFDN